MCFEYEENVSFVLKILLLCECSALIEFSVIEITNLLRITTVLKASADESKNVTSH